MKLLLQTKEKDTVYSKDPLRTAKYFLIQRKNYLLLKILKLLTFEQLTLLSRLERSETLTFLMFHLQISSSAFHLISTLNGKNKMVIQGHYLFLSEVSYNSSEQGQSSA